MFDIGLLPLIPDFVLGLSKTLRLASIRLCCQRLGVVVRKKSLLNHFDYGSFYGSSFPGSS